MPNFYESLQMQYPAAQKTSAEEAAEVAKKSKKIEATTNVKKKSDAEGGMSRRGFLRGAGKVFVAVAGVTAAGSLIKEIGALQLNDSPKDIEPLKAKTEQTQEVASEVEDESVLYNIREEEGQSIRKLTSYDKPGRIELSSGAQIEHWKNEYKNNQKLKNSLTKGYYEMGAWEKDIRRIFKEEGVPEKYIYIALGESHWQIKAISPAKAVGPFQFMQATAVKEPCELEINNFVDKRFDPLDSAKACAALLKDNWRKLNQDWNLALAAYNGSYVWKFKIDARRNDIDVCYSNYLEYMEVRINKKRDEVKNLGSFHYPIGKSETLYGIAEKFGTTASDLASHNHLKFPYKIKRGQKINISYNDKIKKVIYEKEMRGWHENLTYPEKLNAIIELINEKFVTKQVASLNFREIPVKEKVQKIEVYHVKHKENASQIADKFGINLSKILVHNPNISKRNKRLPLKSGTLVKLPIISQRTLSEYAEKKHISLKNLKILNPAILDPNKPIPEGFKIRV